MTKRKLFFLLLAPVIVIINLISFVLISLYHQEFQAGFYFTLWYQIAGFFELANNTGIDVTGSHTEFLPSPNILGWLLIIFNCSIIISIYYLISKKLATFYISRHNKNLKDKKG